MSDIDQAYSQFSRNSVPLYSFMLVARTGTLTAAANILRISQPSLSLRIKNLEASIGRELFVRRSTGISLTDAGAELYALLEPSLTEAARGYADYLKRPETDRVVLSVDHAFASFWLLSRLPRLREELGTTDICIVSSQTPRDAKGSEADIVIAMADGSSDDGHPLFFETVSAICSREVAEEYAFIMAPEDLARSDVPLIHLRTPPGRVGWLDWAGWFAALGVEAPSTRGSEFNTYEMVIRSVRNGHGVALGWHYLIDDYLADGSVVQLLDDRVSTNVCYQIAATASSTTARVQAVVDWIVENAA